MTISNGPKKFGAWYRFLVWMNSRITIPAVEDFSNSEAIEWFPEWFPCFFQQRWHVASGRRIGRLVPKHNFPNGWIGAASLEERNKPSHASMCLSFILNDMPHYGSPDQRRTTWLRSRAPTAASWQSERFITASRMWCLCLEKREAWMRKGDMTRVGDMRNWEQGSYENVGWE